MANTIDVAFIKQFESEVHMAYQRMGSKLRNTVRMANNVTGSTVRFQKIGTGSASTKSRNGNVTPMELAHTQVEATMEDFYAAEYIDKLDELKININERQAVAQSAAAALGRKTDELLYTAMDAGANSTQINDTSGALVLADILTIFETFGTANIPEDGGRYLAMHPKGYADLFNITEFASSDFVGEQNLPFAGGMTMKEFMGFKVFSTSAITAGKNMAYHTSSVGLGINSDVSTEINYVPEKVSHLATSMMSMGCTVIDDNGVYEVLDNN
nr:major capsid protein [uncultured Mediterranean phage uvMED]